MTGLAVLYDPDRLAADLALGAGGGLAVDGGIASACVVSLFTDRRAGPDDPLPAGQEGLFGGDDRRGWCGDALAEVEGDRIGSRLWLLSREKQTEATRARAEGYCREALDWLVEDAHAARIEVAAEWLRMGVLGVRITVHLVAGETARLTFAAPLLSTAPERQRAWWDGGTTLWNDGQVRWWQ